MGKNLNVVSLIQPLQICEVLFQGTVQPLLQQHLLVEANVTLGRFITISSLPPAETLPVIFFLDLFFSFWLLWVFVVAHGLSCPLVCGILVHRPGIQPMSSALESGF